jgi:hypothetical protein
MRDQDAGPNAANNRHAGFMWESTKALVPLWTGLIRARHEPGDGAGQQNAALATAAHRSADELNQIDRPRDVRVDGVSRILEVLIQKPMSEPMPCVGEQRVDGPAGGSGPELVHTLSRRQIRFNDVDFCTTTTEPVSGRLNFRASGSTAERWWRLLHPV